VAQIFSPFVWLSNNIPPLQHNVSPEASIPLHCCQLPTILANKLKIRLSEKWFAEKLGGHSVAIFGQKQLNPRHKNSFENMFLFTRSVRIYPQKCCWRKANAIDHKHHLHRSCTGCMLFKNAKVFPDLAEFYSKFGGSGNTVSLRPLFPYFPRVNPPIYDS
jgi:hypothetical protein